MSLGFRIGETLVSSYVNVAAELQICIVVKAHKSSSISGMIVLSRFPSQDRLAANAKSIPVFFMLRIIAILRLSWPSLRALNAALLRIISSALVQYDDDLSMIGRHAILRKSIEIPRDRNEAGIHFVDCRDDLLILDITL